ncbi:MAG: MaoC family dehydratase N-terminal domain-containing protein [Betaproteobacteria bacterium]
MNTASLPYEALRGWIGRTETAVDVVAAAPARALAATLDVARRFEPGDPLPPPWHWQYFLAMSAMGDVGTDGHPRRGGFLPPVPLPRRMWAGSRMTFFAPLRIGDTIARTSRIVDVTVKEGRSGTLVFVKVSHEITGPQGAALTDEHDIVYRELAQPGDVPPAPRAAPAQSAWRREVHPDPVLLFRYSALTYNSHRIHYDHPYATKVEGYPGLIVHGPLLATLLLDLLLREQPRAVVTHFEFRAMRPVFDVAPFFVCGQPSADASGAQLWIEGGDGFLCMDATARFG